MDSIPTEFAPKNPHQYLLAAIACWEKAFKDKRLTPAQQKEYIQKGIEATDKALTLNPDYVDALTCKNLLLRLQGNVEKDIDQRNKRISEADDLQKRAIELRKKKTSGLP